MGASVGDQRRRWTPIDEDCDPPTASGIASAPDTPLASDSIHDVVAGAGGCCSFTPGGKFALQGHRSEAENRGYVVVAVEHAASDPSFTPAGGGKSYENRFTCIPDTATFRRRPEASRPVVAGPQTAVVAGRKDGEPCENAARPRGGAAALGPRAPAGEKDVPGPRRPDGAGRR